jgi:hypothetical protein
MIRQLTQNRVSGDSLVAIREPGAELPEIKGYYKILMTDFRGDAVGMTIILKEFIQ